MAVQQELKITGMTCNHCAVTVEKALRGVKGVREASVSFPEGTALVISENEFPIQFLLEAVQKAGYGASVSPTTEPSATPIQSVPLHLAIIGSGSAAFACAIRAVEGGARVTMIEAGTLGGTCVNVGCVPSKILIRQAQMAQDQRAHPFPGLRHYEPIIDRKALVKQQQERVLALREAKYAHVLTSHPDISFVAGYARFADTHTLLVEKNDGTRQAIQADRFLIAVGASPQVPAIAGLAETPYWTSTEALVAEELPRHLLVLGGSVVALELAQAFRRLGSEVTILARSTLLSKEDPALGQDLQTALENEGIQIHTHTVPRSVRYGEGVFTLECGSETIHGDRLLVATGRIANTQGLGLAEIGVETLPNGAIPVNERMQSNVPHIYAAGDCTSLPQFVYVAAAGGTRAAVNLLGGNARLDLSVMPAVVFTDPQVATVGLDEQQARKQGLDVESRTLGLDNVPRALANFNTQGFIKLVAEKGSGKLVGAQILAAEGGEIVQAAALALRGGLTIQDLADQLFPYLTMVEGLKLCAQTFTKDVSQLSCCAG